jgi:hypothetical protein
MDVEIMFREVKTIPEDASVCHYDELSDRAKHCLACLVREETATSVGLKTANELTQYDGIKYTTYYELRRRAPPRTSQPSD